MLDTRLYSPSLKDIAGPEDAHLIFELYIHYLAKFTNKCMEN